MLSSKARASVAVSTGVLARLEGVFGAAHGMGRVQLEDLPVTSQSNRDAQRRQVLFDRRRGQLALEVLMKAAT